MACEDCGEVCFDAEVCLELYRMWESPSPPNRKVEVLVYPYCGTVPQVPEATVKTPRLKRPADFSDRRVRAQAKR